MKTLIIALVVWVYNKIKAKRKNPVALSVVKQPILLPPEKYSIKDVVRFLTAIIHL